MANKIPLVIADFETQLSSAINAGSTSFTISSATDDDGNSLAAGKYCFTVNNGSSNKQYLMGQLNGTTVTSVVHIDRRGNETSGSEYAARAGSPVIISDFATIQRVADILRGQETLDSDNPIYYDGEPTLSNREELATVAYVLDNVNGGTVNFDNQIISSSDATAGETIAAGDWVFFDTSDQEWYKVDADTASEVNGSYIGVALGAGTDGASITGGIQISGVYTTTGLTAGDIYYLSNTAGEITNSAGTTERAIGVALSTTKLLLNFQEKRLPTASEKDFLSATTGMISMYGGSSAPTGFLLCDGSAVSRTTYSSLFSVISTTYGTGDGSTTFNVPDLRSAFPLGYGQRVETFDFVDGDVDTGNDDFDVDSNDWLQTGTAVVLSNSGGTLPGGLSAQTYYIIRNSATNVSLATSVANANAGTKVDITSAAGGGTHTLTLTLTDRSLADEGGEETHALTDAEMPSHQHGADTYVGSGSDNRLSQGNSGSGSSSLSNAVQAAGSDTKHNNMPPYVVVNYIIKT